MTRRDQNDQLVARDRLALQGGRVDRPLDEAELGLALDDRGRDLGGVADDQLERDARMGAAKGGEVAWQPVAGDRLAGLQPQPAGGGVGQRREQRLGAPGLRQHGLRRREEQPADLRQDDSAPLSMEKFGAVPGLQGRQRGADGGLAEMERGGGARDVAGARDGGEDAKLFEGHRSFNDFFDEFDKYNLISCSIFPAHT